jgi:hypothetical protein
MARERSCERDRGDRLHGSCACAVVSGDDDSTRRDPPPDVVATLSDRVEYRNVGTRVGDTVRIAQLVKGVQVYGESLDDTPTAALLARYMYPRDEGRPSLRAGGRYESVS